MHYIFDFYCIAQNEENIMDIVFAEYTQKAHKFIPSMSSKLFFNAAEAEALCRRLLDPSREDDKTLLKEALILNGE